MTEASKVVYGATHNQKYGSAKATQISVFASAYICTLIIDRMGRAIIDALGYTAPSVLNIAHPHSQIHNTQTSHTFSAQIR